MTHQTSIQRIRAGASVLLVAALVFGGSFAFSTDAAAQNNRRQPGAMAWTAPSIPGMSQAGQDALTNAYSQNQTQQGSPAFLWQVAEELKGQLSAADRQLLIDSGNATVSNARAVRNTRSGGRSGARSGGRMNNMPMGGPGANNTFRDASQAAMLDVLNLTADQQAAIEKLRADQMAQMQALRGTARPNPALRADMQAQRLALMDEHQENLAKILTPDQMATWEIHQALMSSGAWNAQRPNRRR